MPPGKKFTAEQIIGKLREAEVGLAQLKTVPEVVRKLGVTEQTYYRWKRELPELRAAATAGQEHAGHSAVPTGRERATLLESALECAVRGCHAGGLRADCGRWGRRTTAPAATHTAPTPPSP